MSKKKKIKKKIKKSLEPLEAIKRLLILDLYIKDIPTREIGAILDVSYKTIERMIPKSVKRNTKKRKNKKK